MGLIVTHAEIQDRSPSAAGGNRKRFKRDKKEASNFLRAFVIAMLHPLRKEQDA